MIARFVDWLYRRVAPKRWGNAKETVSHDGYSNDYTDRHGSVWAYDASLKAWWSPNASRVYDDLAEVAEEFGPLIRSF